MLRSLKSLEGYRVGASDGLIGQVRDFYFDDEAWVVRYLIVDTGEPPHGRKVLISPISVQRPDWTERIFPVYLTRDQVKKSPDIDTDKPVSRQQEMGYLGYYGYGNYWGGGGLWGAGLYPDIIQAGRQTKTDRGRSINGRPRRDNPHLRSVNALLRYYVHATDGDLGHVNGFLLEERTWAIRYLIVNTSNWWLGHEVVIAPGWIKEVNWADSTVSVQLSRHSIKTAPPYEPTTVLDHAQEKRIHAHHGRSGDLPAPKRNLSVSSR
jgi:hypothetical protein